MMNLRDTTAMILRLEAAGKPVPIKLRANQIRLVEFGERMQRKRNKKKRETKAAFWKAKAKKSFYSTAEWKRVRYEVLRDCGARCQCCGKNPREHGITLNVDHIKPLRTHWELRLEKSNLQVLCSDCNWGKGSHDTTDWRRNIDSPSEQELARIRELFDMDAPERI